MLNKIIFAVDGNKDLHTVAKFMRHMDTCRAMNTLSGSFVKCIGMYKGDLEPSYMMDEVDYRKLVESAGYTAGQESILHVPGDTRQPCTLEFRDGSTKVVGPMVEVDAGKAMFLPSWTYNMETSKYFSTEGNAQ